MPTPNSDDNRVRIDKDMMARLRRVADMQQVSPQLLVNMAVAWYLGMYPTHEGTPQIVPHQPVRGLVPTEPSENIMKEMMELWD